MTHLDSKPEKGSYSIGTFVTCLMKELGGNFFNGLPVDWASNLTYLFKVLDLELFCLLLGPTGFQLMIIFHLIFSVVTLYLSSPSLLLHYDNIKLGFICLP